jgi:hypothetical protein
MYATQQNLVSLTECERAELVELREVVATVRALADEWRSYDTAHFGMVSPPIADCSNDVLEALGRQKEPSDDR